MGNEPEIAEDWAGYLKRMTSRPGWSVARLAREAGMNRGSIFRWIRGTRGVTVSSVKQVAAVLGDDPANALRAAAGSVVPEERDEEIQLVLTDERLTDDTKKKIVALILERREQARLAALADTQRIIEAMRSDEQAG